MRTLSWSRTNLIAEIRRDLWRYLTPSASIEAELLEAAALLQIPSHELRVLGRLQFLISDELGKLIEQLPFLVRRLATTTASEEEWSAERIRGAIQWGRTIGVRQATGIPHIYVTSPARRAFQTPENELLVTVLDATVQLGRQTGWHRSERPDIGRLINARVAQAELWLRARSLLEVERRPMTPTKLARIRSGRHRRRYQAVLDAYDRYRNLAERLNRTAIRNAVEAYGIVSRDDPTLFELVCTFRTIDALKSLGWQLDRLGLFAGSLRLTGRKGHQRLELSYQRTPTKLARGSAYHAIQKAHAISPGALRPDLVIRHERGSNNAAWLVIEAKGGERPVDYSARAAAYDLLAYRTAYAHTLNRQDRPYGLGIAYGAELEPSSSNKVMLCTPDTLSLALARFLT
jgi:hypothetical protein